MASCAENSAALEDLRLQRHVLKGSLAVGRERAASATLIQRNLQHAATTLSPAALRKVLLHLVSSTLSAYAAACSSRADVHQLQASLDRTSKLNELLTVQVTSSNGSSALFSAAGTCRTQVHAAHAPPALVGSPRHPPEAHSEHSPRKGRAIHDVGASYSSPAAMDCAVGSVGKQTVRRTPGHQPDALSADSLLLNAAHGSPVSLSSNPQVSSVARLSEQQVQLTAVSQMPHSMHSSSSSSAGLPDPRSPSVGQTPRSSLNRMQLQSSGYQGAMIDPYCERRPDMPAQVDADKAAHAVVHSTQLPSSKLNSNSVLLAAEPQHGSRPTTPVAGLRTHSMQPASLQSHAIANSASFCSTDFTHVASFNSMAASDENDAGAMDGGAGSGHREPPSPASAAKQARPRSATPKRVSFADEQGWTPGSLPTAGPATAGPATASGTHANQSPSARSVGSTDPGVFNGSAACMERRVSLERSGAAPIQASLGSPRARPRSASVGQAVARNSDTSMARTLSSFNVRDNPVAAEWEGMIDSRCTPIAFPAGPGPSSDTERMLQQSEQDDLTTPVKRFAASGYAVTSGRDPLHMRSERALGKGRDRGLHKSPVGAVTGLQAKPAPSPRASRTPPAKVQAYRKKLEELQAKSCDGQR